MWEQNRIKCKSKKMNTGALEKKPVPHIFDEILQ